MFVSISRRLSSLNTLLPRGLPSPLWAGMPSAISSQLASAWRSDSSSQASLGPDLGSTFGGTVPSHLQCHLLPPRFCPPRPKLTSLTHLLGRIPQPSARVCGPHHLGTQSSGDGEPGSRELTPPPARHWLVRSLLLPAPLLPPARG